MPNLWDRREDERSRPYAAFMDYCAMNGGRSIRVLFAHYRQQSADFMAARAATKKPPTRRLRTIMTWCSRFDWPERAAAWDAHMRTKEEDKWAEFLEGLREKERKVADALLDKAQEMLGKPLADDTDWRVVDSARLASEGSKLGRKAAGVEEGEAKTTVEIILKTVGGGVAEGL